MAISHICDECGNELEDDELEWADIDDDHCVCAFCNSEEIPAENYDGRYED